MAAPDEPTQALGPDEAPTAVDPGWPGEQTLVAPAEPLPPGPPPVGPPPPGPPDGRRLDRALAVGLLVLLLLVAAGIAAAVLLGRHHGEKTGAGSTRPATTAPTTTAASSGSRTTPSRPRSPVVAVPRVVGVKAAAAMARVHALGIGAHLQSQHSTSPKGTVTGQLPPAGSKLRRGSAITLLVSSGPRTAPVRRVTTVAVPDVLGLSRAAATARITAAGLQPRTRATVTTKPAGTVLSASPAAGSRIAAHTPVVLVVATAPPRTTIPDLVGKTRLGALAALRRAKLSPRVHLVPSQQAKAGTVVAQYPQPGLVVPRGRAVRVNVAVASGQGGGAIGTTVPDVTSEDEQQATSDLQDAGFTVQSTDQAVSDQSEDGTVLDQTPAGGASARSGATVTIVVGRYSG